MTDMPADRPPSIREAGIYAQLADVPAERQVEGAQIYHDVEAGFLDRYRWTDGGWRLVQRHKINS